VDHPRATSSAGMPSPASGVSSPDTLQSRLDFVREARNSVTKFMF
jgi:hypothetical protein